MPLSSNNHERIAADVACVGGVEVGGWFWLAMEICNHTLGIGCMYNRTWCTCLRTYTSWNHTQNLSLSLRLNKQSPGKNEFCACVCVFVYLHPATRITPTQSPADKRMAAAVAAAGRICERIMLVNLQKIHRLGPPGAPKPIYTHTTQSTDRPTERQIKCNAFTIHSHASV